MPRKFRESRYRLEATIPLSLLSEIEKIGRDQKLPVSRVVERMLKVGLYYYFEDQQQDSFNKDLEAIKEIDRIRKSLGVSK